MTEFQDTQITKALNCSSWSMIEDDRADGWKVYQADNSDNTLFAIDTNSNKVSFDVYEADEDDKLDGIDSEFVIY